MLSPFYLTSFKEEMILKIGLVSTYLPQKCGIATYTDYLTSALRKVNSNLKIKIIAEKGAKPLTQKNYEVITPWQRNEDYVSQILSYTADIDILHIQHEYGIYGFNYRIIPLLEKLAPEIKKIVTIHCIRPSQIALPERGDIEEKLAAKIAQSADEIIVHLETQKSILERLGIPREKITVIPHGTEITDINKKVARQKLNLPQDKKIILLFGFIKKHKQPHIAIKALSELLEKGNDVVLFLAGRLPPNPREPDVEYFKSLQQKIRNFPYPEHIIFPNRFFPNEDVPYLLRAADLILFPYIEDSRAASGVLHLAIGAKTPVIASRIPKFEELQQVSDELIFPSHNPEMVSKIISRIFNDPEFKNYVVNRMDFYRKLTSWENIAHQHIKIYLDQ